MALPSMLNNKFSMESNKILIPAGVAAGFYAFLCFNFLIFFLYLMLSLFLLVSNKLYLKRSFNLVWGSQVSLLLILVFISAPIVFLNNFNVLVYLPLTMLSMLLSMVYVREGNQVLFYKGIALVAYVYMSQIILFLFFHDGFDMGSFALEEMIEGFSSNGVTSFLIVIVSVYTLLRIVLFRKSSCVMAALTLYICMLGYGRGSVISALVLLFINIFYVVFYNGVRRESSNLLRVFVVIIGAGVFVVYAAQFVVYLQHSTKLSAGFSDVRVSILQEYLAEIGLYDIFFGASYEGTSIVTQYNGNPHNSFIRAHHTMGLAYLLLIGYLMALACYSVLRRLSVVSFAAWLVLLNMVLRAYTEPIFFPTIFDCFFYAGVLLVLRLNIRGQASTVAA